MKTLLLISLLLLSNTPFTAFADEEENKNCGRLKDSDNFSKLNKILDCIELKVNKNQESQKDKPEVEKKSKTKGEFIFDKEVEPNDHVSDANQIEIGKNYKGTIHKERDEEDFFYFSTKKINTDSIRVLVRKNKCSSWLYATLVDYLTEKEIGYKYHRGKTNVSVKFPIKPNKKYYLIVRNNSSKSCNYEVRVTPEASENAS